MSMLAHVMPHRDVVVGNAKDKFDEDGHLIDEVTQQFLRAYLQDLAAWTRRVSKQSTAEASISTTVG